MKKIFTAGAVLLLTFQFLCLAYAVEICEPQDVYNLMDTKECLIEYNKAGHTSDPQDAMFDIMKNYPYERKGRLIKLLQRKIELVDSYITQQPGQGQAKKSEVNISKLEQTKQGLAEQLGLVNAATADNWVSVRDRARKVLEEAARKLREIE